MIFFSNITQPHQFRRGNHETSCHVCNLPKILNIVQPINFLNVNVIRLSGCCKNQLKHSGLLKENKSRFSNLRVLGRILALKLNSKRWFELLTIKIIKILVQGTVLCRFSNKSQGVASHINHIKNKKSICKLNLFILTRFFLNLGTPKSQDLNFLKRKFQNSPLLLTKLKIRVHNTQETSNSKSENGD